MRRLTAPPLTTTYHTFRLLILIAFIISQRQSALIIFEHYFDFAASRVISRFHRLRRWASPSQSHFSPISCTPTPLRSLLAACIASRRLRSFWRALRCARAALFRYANSFRFIWAEGLLSHIIYASVRDDMRHGIPAIGTHQRAYISFSLFCQVYMLLLRRSRVIVKLPSKPLIFRHTHIAL